MNEDPELGRSVLRGAVGGAASFFLGTTGLMVWLGVGVGAAVGLGLFIAFWGGLGFGTMVGGVLHVARLEREHRAAP